MHATSRTSPDERVLTRHTRTSAFPEDEPNTGVHQSNSRAAAPRFGCFSWTNRHPRVTRRRAHPSRSSSSTRDGFRRTLSGRLHHGRGGRPDQDGRFPRRYHQAGARRGRTPIPSSRARLFASARTLTFESSHPEPPPRARRRRGRRRKPPPRKRRSRRCVYARVIRPRRPSDPFRIRIDRANAHLPNRTRARRDSESSRLTRVLPDPTRHVSSLSRRPRRRPPRKPRRR